MLMQYLLLLHAACATLGAPLPVKSIEFLQSEMGHIVKARTLWRC